MTGKRCVVATRESPLALWQAEHVRDLVTARHPGVEVALLGMTTRGDKILDRTLSKVGGKGLFVKELEAAIAAGEADLAVHSLKDVPMELPPGFALVAVSDREDPRDAFVSGKYASLADMPAGARVATSSLRRELMVRRARPDLEVVSVRGNVGTRLRKLDEGQFEAMVMACAGLRRLGLADRIRSEIPVGVSLPSPGQGVLGIEAREGDAETAALVAFLDNPQVRACVVAERAVSRALGGSCQVPLAAYAIVEDGELWLRALVGNHKTGEQVAVDLRGPVADPEGLAAQAVAALRAQGADEILAAVLRA